jgi:hypothetical protein
VVSVLLVLQKSTRVWEKTIQNNVVKSLPKGSSFYIGKINGNVFGNFTIDSFYVNIDTSLEVGIHKIKLIYSLWSIIKGVPRLVKVEVTEPVVRIHAASNKNTGIPQKSIPFNFDEHQIEFERLLPDTFHLTFQKIIKTLPDVQFNRIIFKNFSLQLDHKPVLTHTNFVISYTKRRIRLESFSGNLLNKVDFVKGRFHADIDKDAILISQLHFETPKSVVGGKIDIDFAEQFKALLVLDECTFKEDIAQLTLEDVSNSSIDAQGYVYLYPESLYFDISAKGQYNDITLEKSNIRGILGRTSAFIRSLWIKSNVGVTSGKIFTRFGGRTYFDIFLKKINLHYLAGGIDTSSINTHIQANVDSWIPADMSGNIQIHVTNSVINEMSLNKAFLKIRAQKGFFEIDSSSGLYMDKENRILLSGVFNSKLQGNIKLSFIDLNFKKVGEALSLPSLKGFGSGSFELEGDLHNPEAKSYLLLDSLGYSNFILYGIEESIEMKNLFRNRVGYYKLDISSGMIGDIFLTDALVGLTIQNNQVHIDSLTFYNIENFVNIKGNIIYGKSNIDVNLPLLAISYQSLELYNDEPIEIVIVPEQSNLTFENFHLITNKGGEVDARGMLSWDRSSSFALFLRQINLNFINQFDLFDFSARGLANLEITMEKTLTNPILEFDASFFQLQLDTLNLGEIVLAGTVENSFLNLKNFSWTTPEDTLYFSAKYIFNPDSVNLSSAESENQFQLHITKFDISKFKNLFALNVPLKGIIRGNLEFKTDEKHYIGDGSVRLSQFQYADYHLDSLYLLPQFRDSILAIRTGELDIGQTTFYFTGKTIFNPVKFSSIQFKKLPISLFVSTKTADLGFIGDMNEEVQNIHGNIQASLQIDGRLDQLKLSYGRISIQESELYLYKLANPLHIKEGMLTIKNNLIQIEKLEGSSQEGKIEEGLLTRLINWIRHLGKQSGKEGMFALSGTIQLDSELKPAFDLTLKAKRVFINYFIEDVRILASTDRLTIKGRDTISISGKVTINRGKYLFDADRYERSLLLSATEVETPPYLVLNLDVEIPGNFYFKQEGQLNRMSFEMLGNLRILKEAGGLIEPYGTLEILSGDMALYGKKLQVMNGKISFTNPKELPNIEITATYKSPPYYFEISETGRIDAPDLKIDLYDFDTRTPISGFDIKDKLSLLVTGMTFDDLTKQGDLAIKEQGMDLAAKSLLNFLEGRTEQLVGLDKVSLETTNKLNEGIGDISLSLGKYITSSLYFEFRSPFARKLSWEPGSEVFFSYRLSRNWSIGTSLSKTEEGNNKVSFNFLWKIYF